jgi:hypothetical protein
LFFVAKSQNKNQVHYGIHLDEACVPVGAAPVFAYWRMLERGPSATEPLLAREARAYGFADQRVIARDEHGGRVRVTLAALPARPILVQSWLGSATCVASATMPITGVPATLASVFVQLRWPLGVDHLLISGRALADGRVLREKVAQ